jgi:hypothetical protein
MRQTTRFRDVVHILCWESVFAVAFDAWVSPAYLSGLAGELKISVGLLSVVAAIPWIGASGQILGVWSFDKCTSVKWYVLGMAGLGRAFWLIPLVLSLYWGSQSYYYGAVFPAATWFVITATCASLSSLISCASMNAWMYWVKILLPNKFQGRFFGYRQRFTTAAVILTNLVAATLVDWKPQGYHVGLGLLCTLALLSGLISILLNSKVHDVPVERPSNEHPRSLKELFGTPFKDRGFRKFLLYGVAFNGSLQFAGSYFPYYFTKELHLPMSYFALWSGIASLGCFLASNYWGRRIDKTGLPFEVLRITSLAIALAPLVYLIKSPEIIKIIAPLEYLFSGLAWSGFLLAQTKILLRLSPIGDSAAYFSVYATLCGLSGAIFTFLGGQLVQVLVARGEFRLFWLIATVMRLLMMQLSLTESEPKGNGNKKFSFIRGWSASASKVPPLLQAEEELLQTEEKPKISIREPLSLPEA